MFENIRALLRLRRRHRAGCRCTPACAAGLRSLKRCHSCIVAVPRPRVGINPRLVVRNKDRPGRLRPRRLSAASGALQLVPPPPMAASLLALVITLSRGFSVISTTSCSNGSTSADAFLRTTAAATSAATSMQRTALVDPLRYPVTGDDIEPDTSGQTYTLPASSGTF